MHSGHTAFSQEPRSLPPYPAQIPYQDSPFSRPGSLSSYHTGAEWNLESPSDVDLDDDERYLPTALSRGAELNHNKLHNSPHLHSSSTSLPMPISAPSSTSPPHNLSVSPAAMFLAAFSPSMAPAPLPDDEGQIVAGYTLDGIIGYGGSSIIRRAFSASGGVVAVKIVKRSDIQKQPNPDLARRILQHEADVWSSLSHEHILPLFSAVHTSYADFFVTPFCPAGSMYDILQRDGTPALPQDDVGMMFRQVVRGLRYLHETAMFVHRDIKLENVLVDEMGVCRIADFGMSRKIGEIDDDDLELDAEEEYEHDHFHHRAASMVGTTSRRETRSSLQPSSAIARHGAVRHRNSTSAASNLHPVRVCQPGSLPYAAPELLLPQTNGPLSPHPAQDIWALGVMLYALLTGRFPFNDSFEPRLQMKILHGTFELPVGTGKGAERVFKGCLERCVHQRWSIAMVDEVAWGIGWGSEGDDVTPTESDEEYETHRRPSTRPASRSCSRPPALVVPMSGDDSSQQEDRRTRRAREAASRRSASRAKRSQSRAPVPTHLHQPYSGRSLSRGVITSRSSRAASPAPTAALSASIMSSAESPFLASPGSSIDRGRRPFRNSPLFPSRSPSPSIVPGTPVDFGAPFNMSFSASLPVVSDQPNEPDELRLDRVEEEEKRGRSKSTRGLRAPPLSFSSSDNSDNDNLNVDVGHWGGNLATATGAVGDEDNRAPYNFSVDSDKERSRSCGFSLRALSPSSRSSRGPARVRHSYQHHHHHYAHEPYEYDHEFWTKKKKGKRTGSQPPTPATPSSTPWSAPTWATGQSLPISPAAINAFLKKLATPSTDPVEMMRRGRSVDRGIGWS